jgi:2-polyprenyl-3-methyl-5-hydroxy-6-metoxy-1,4-benzoquinol methylase
MKYTAEKYLDPYDETNILNKHQSETFSFIQKKIKKPGSLLDIGCGNGKILVLGRDNGWKVRGLELSPSLADSISEKFGIEVTISNFLTYEPAKEEQYDLVILRHVLEHLQDSILAMTKINQLLKPGGFGVLEFPDIESNQMKLKRFISGIGIYSKKYKETYLPGHCNEFCEESFKYLLSKTGFKLLEWQNYSSKSYLNGAYNLFHFGTKARVLIKKI